MADYYVIDDSKVINIIVADSLEIAQEVTGKICVVRDENNYVDIGYHWNGEEFIKPTTEEPVA